MRNNNQAIVRKITRRTLRTNKRRNFFLIAAIALTAFMMASVFSVGISLIENINNSPFRLEGTFAHMGFIGNEDDKQVLEQLDYVRHFGVGTWVGSGSLPGFESPVSMIYMDRNTWDNFSSPAYTNIVGRYATNDNEIMLSRHKLNVMGIENPYIGMAITMDFTITGSEDVITETFTLAAIYSEFVSIRENAATPIIVSQDFAARHGLLDTDYWNIQVIFRSQARAMEYAERLARDLNLGENWLLGVNIAVLIGQNVNHVPTYITMGIIIAFLMLTGFLLIYNVMYVSVSKDVRFYGLLKTLGTTPRQLRHIVNGQVLRLYLVGLPIGLLIAAGASFAIVPAFLAASTSDVVSFSPIIYLGSGVFSLLTAYLGAFTSAKKAARVSPIEALRYAGEQSIVIPLQKRPKAARIFATRQGSADDAGQEGPLEGADAGLWQKDRRIGTVLEWNDYTKVKVRISSKGKPGKLAFRNVFRERKRAFVVLVSLFLGISVFTIILTVLNSLDMDIPINAMHNHDFTISSTVLDGLSRGFVDQVSAIPYVTEVRPDIFTTAILDYSEYLTSYVNFLAENCQWAASTPEGVIARDLGIGIIGIDIAWLKEWNERQENPLTPAEVEAFGRGELILIDEIPFRFRFGFSLSDYEMNQVFPKGMALDMTIWEMRSEIAHISTVVGGFANFMPGTGRSFSAGPINIFMSTSFLFELFGDEARIVHLHLNVADGRDEVVLNSLNLMLGNNHEMASRHEARLRYSEQRQTMLVLGTGLSAILGIIGIFNFINVITVGLLVRKREFAALESVGMAKRQMRAMLRWEGAIYWIMTLFAAGTVGNGIAIGLFTLLRNSGEPAFANLSYPFIAIGLVYAIVIFICSVTPEIAYKSMSKLTLVERLREAE